MENRSPNRLLIVDADIEAPGMTWLQQDTMKDTFSYLDLLTLIQDNRDIDEIVNLACSKLKRSTITIETTSRKIEHIFLRHHHPPPGQPLQGRQGVRSKENCGLELKSFHRASPVSSLMGLVWQTRRKLYGSLFFAFLHKKFTGFSSDLTFTTGVLRYIIDLKNI